MLRGKVWLRNEKARPRKKFGAASAFNTPDPCFQRKIPTMFRISPKLESARTSPFRKGKRSGRLQKSEPTAATWERLTFDRLCQMEPRLASLLQRASEVRDDETAESFCANRTWYGYENLPHEGIKEQLCSLVGSDREDLPQGHVLRSSLAYELAYQTIYNVLPPCRNCSCIGLNKVIGIRRQ